MDALAVIYARELTRWGIETSIIIPGVFTSGTNHFAHTGSPADKARAAEYEAGPYAGIEQKILEGFAAIVPPDADVAAVADAIVRVVDLPFGKRPFRVHVDPTQDGAEVVNAVSDGVRAELLRRIGLGDLLIPQELGHGSRSGNTPPVRSLPQAIDGNRVIARASRPECYPVIRRIEPCQNS
jgi:hypothetical protein